MGKKEPSEVEDRIASQVVDAAYAVHKALGPGLLERVYEACLCRELDSRGLEVSRQVALPITYKGASFDDGLRLDLLIEGCVVCELKAGKDMHPVWEAQLLSYLRLSNKRLGLLINFCVPRIRDGIRRMVCS